MFKVGDKVVRVKTGSGLIPIGTIVTVVEMQEVLFKFEPEFKGMNSSDPDLFLPLELYNSPLYKLMSEKE